MHHSYISQFLVGGILFTLIAYFTKQKNTFLTSLLPAYPFLFLVGLIYLLFYEGDSKSYIKNNIYTFGLALLFIILLDILLHVHRFTPVKSVVIATLLFVLSTIILSYHKILK